MTLTTRQKTLALTAISQVPMALLLVIFYSIPGIPVRFRVAGLIIVLFEAALMTELIGNIVQKVRANDRCLYVRGVLERKRIPWGEVQELRQVVVSPMKKSLLCAPAKAFLIKTRAKVRLRAAEDWWVEEGPLSNGRKGMLDLVEKYEEHVRKSLEGWLVLWDVEYRRPQGAEDDVKAEYLSLDGRENAIIDDLSHHAKARQLLDVWDLTYPTFFKKHGGRYKKDVEHLWDTVT
ncbi:hypothetical protein JXA12_02445 [Candidatus Woesearchaeota archaeon]|nr:hypothetical protein [Candidatus Woesearchaeota archaeon]